MTIETKYNIGDEVWFFAEGEPCNMEILAISVEKYKDNCFIRYMLSDNGFPFELYEQDLFPTKEELIKSL